MVRRDRDKAVVRQAAQLRGEHRERPLRPRLVARRQRPAAVLPAPAAPKLLVALRLRVARRLPGVRKRLVEPTLLVARARAESRPQVDPPARRPREA